MSRTRYPAPLVILHWLVAILILGMLGSGLLVGSELLPKMQEFQLIQWHKAFGVAVLLLVGLRVVVRLWAMVAKQIPPLPQAFKWWELKAAHLGHLGLYAAMIGLPLTGWLMVSSSPYGLPTLLWGSVAWPHLPGVAGLAWVNEVAKESHELLAYAMLALLAAHVGAVLKHYYTDKINLLPRVWFGVLALLVLVVPSVQAAPYQLEMAQSKVSFKGTHAGAQFTGSFTQWNAHIDWNTANPTQSKLSATFQTASAKTGNPTYDATLPTTDWFNTEKFPTATFASTEIMKGAKANTYTAKGILTLRGVAQPVALTFTLTPVPGATNGALRALGGLTIDRLAYGMGAASDPAAEWVSRPITIMLDVVGVPTKH
jgi:cytochrome b561